MATSKNQRSGPKLKPKPHLCAKGHEQVYVMTQPMRGGRQFKWMCECNGYVPIEITKDYKPNHPRIKAAGGKARIWFEQPAKKS